MLFHTNPYASRGCWDDILSHPKCCGEVLEMQLSIGWPCIFREVKEICSAVGLEDVTKKDLRREKVKK